MATTLFKLRKTPTANPLQCDATRCDEEGAGNIPGDLWRRQSVRLCLRHTATAIAFAEKNPDYVPQIPDTEAEPAAPLPESVTTLVPAGLTLANHTVLSGWMERVKVIAAELPAMTQIGTEVLAYAKAFEIRSHDELVEASEYLREAVTMVKAIAGKKKEITSPLSAALARIREIVKPAEQPWVDAEAVLRAKVEAARLREDAQNKLAMQEAASAHAAGDDPSAAIAKMTVSSDLKGVSTTVFWKAVVIDVNAMPDEYIVRLPNQLKLKEYCSKVSPDSEPEPIAGVAFEKDASSRVQGKK